MLDYEGYVDALSRYGGPLQQWKKIKQLSEDLDCAKFIGKNSHESARRLWSKGRARKRWQFVLNPTREESIACLREERESLWRL
jgi:hypothetical protein